MKDFDYGKILQTIAENPEILRTLAELLQCEISMPNIPMPTMGGKVMWNTVAEYSGWKLQQNMISHHARILDSKNVRRAWGTMNGMDAALKRLSGK